MHYFQFLVPVTTEIVPPDIKGQILDMSVLSTFEKFLGSKTGKMNQYVSIGLLNDKLKDEVKFIQITKWTLYRFSLFFGLCLSPYHSFSLPVTTIFYVFRFKSTLNFHNWD